jgi:uncharacterized protein YndB with AHSA1/START domain
MEKPFSFTLERYINVSADKVFEALTNAEIILAWCGSDGRISPEKGGEIEMFGGWVTGHVLIYEPNQALAYTWKPEDWEENVPESDVFYTFLPKNGGTIITLTHAGFPNQTESDNHATGWEDYVFGPMEDYFDEH